MSLLAARGVGYAYGDRTVLEGVDLEIRKGDFLGIVGPNGSGKSTLIGLLGGVLAPREGEVRMQGRPLSGYSRRELARLVAVVPQRTEILFPYLVEEIVAMGRTPYLGWGGWMSEGDRRACAAAMELTGTSSLRGRTLDELSAGERQRVLIARGLAQETPLLLLDEASGFLDIGQERAVFATLERLREERGIAVASVSHDLNLIGAFARRILLLDGGRPLAEGPAAETLRGELLSELFGVAVSTGPRPGGGITVSW